MKKYQEMGTNLKPRESLSFVIKFSGVKSAMHTRSDCRNIVNVALMGQDDYLKSCVNQ